MGSGNGEKFPHVVRDRDGAFVLGLRGWRYWSSPPNDNDGTPSDRAIEIRFFRRDGDTANLSMGARRALKEMIYQRTSYELNGVTVDNLIVWYTGERDIDKAIHRLCDSICELFANAKDFNIEFDIGDALAIHSDVGVAGSYG